MGKQRGNSWFCCLLLLLLLMAALLRWQGPSQQAPESYRERSAIASNQKTQGFGNEVGTQTEVHRSLAVAKFPQQERQ